jgi:hypothetical protein
MILGAVAAAAPVEEEGGLVYVGGRSETRQASGGWALSLTGLTGGVGTQPAEGDLVIIAYANSSALDRDLAVSGYTELTDLYVNDTFDCQLGVYYKIMSSSPDTSATLTAYTNINAAAVHVWRGVNATTPMDVTRAVATGTNTGVPNPPALTPVTAGAVIVVVGAYAAEFGHGAALTAASLDNFVQAHGDGSGNNFHVGVGVGSIEWTSGSYDPAAFGGGEADTSNSWCACTLALRPA